jgi:hypothetical protein
MDKEIRAQRLAAKVTAVERSIDDTLALAAELMIEGRAASAEWNLAAQTTDVAFAKLIEAMGQIQAARTSVVATHKRMEKVRDLIGIRTTGIQPVKEASAEIEPVAEREVVRLHG